MTLKRQLFIASLLMLLIPWAGLQFVLELDEALRAQAAIQLQNQAERVAGFVAEHSATNEAIEPGTEVIYADILSRPLNLDGYGDDWPGYDEEESRPQWQDTGRVQSNGPARVSWQAAVDRNHLFLLIQVSGRKAVAFDPGNPEQPYDQIQLDLTSGGETVQRVIRTQAPGSINAIDPGRDSATDYRISGYWQAVSNGYQAELRVPRPDPSARFGFQVTWPGTDANASDDDIVSTGPESARIVTRLPELESRLEAMIAPGQGAWVLEPDGWVIARKAREPDQDKPEFDSLSPFQILERISLNGLRALVRFYQPEPLPLDNDSHRIGAEELPSRGLVRHRDGDTYMLVKHPLTDGRVLVLEESLDQLLALSGSTLGSVIARSVPLITGLMLVLLGYASWLSWRITRLQRAVSNSIDDDGRVLGALPPAKAKDELGDLSRQFSHMTERLQGYTDYLESFSRRLSHELKTPVAVVRSSLENLSHTTDPADQASYIERARSATDRLSQILQGMSEAARLEQSFDHAEKETFDLADVAAQTTHAYQSLDPEHKIEYSGPAKGCPCHGSPELLVQLLDKLVDNARDFTPAGGRIEVRLKPGPKQLELSVFNEGSSLPENLSSDIFSPFVSVRTGKEEGHLGQGLLIVRLIAEHHNGQVLATNEPGGVRFTVVLPAPA
ncbi:ATP-binding protein [Marinobacter sp. HL-58]|uniref:ATP-binding protein n=1 Tax=Marinobacter sp. HL-58 TaxID=1479237 RepID=UPI0004850FCD|nr:ATP-binding protein [Marinobacter sp. HL-58]KPP97377.1 MAG: sortase system two-component signal transduction system histidine kinase [Marinobacter sp. HL-58]